MWKHIILPMALVLAGIGSIPPVVAQDADQQQRQTQPVQIPSEFADLAEEYADQKANAVASAQAKTYRQQRKRWTQQLREATNSLDSTLDRFDRIDNLVSLVEASDPDIPKVKAEIAARTDRAYQQAKQWAEVEEVAAALPDAFANAVTERFGVHIGFRGQPPPTSGELVPPRGNTPPVSGGWLSETLNSSEAKGAGGAAGLALLLLALKRMKDKDKEDADKRNAKVSEEAARRAWQREQTQTAGGQAGGSGG